MKKILMVIPPERFRDEELFETQKVLEAAGYKTVIASTHVGRCAGSRGGFATSTQVLANVAASDYCAVVFVGGGGSKLLYTDKDALNIAKEFSASNKVIAAICLAPVILANAGVLKGKKVTVCGKESTTVEKLGAHYTAPGVTVDGNLVTANGPKSSTLFGQKIVEVLDATTKS